MSTVLKIFLCIILVIQLVLIIVTMRKKNMSMKYATIWIVLTLLMFVAVLFPHFIIVFSKFCGFEATSNMVFLIAFFVLFYMSFVQTISISKMRNQITDLIQEISILKKEIQNGKKD